MLNIFGVEVGPLINILTPLLGAIFGFITGMFARIAPKWYQKKVNRRKLRRALLAEIRAPKRAIESASQIGDDERVELNHGVLPDTVYQEHVDDLGLLSEEEVEAIVKYYSTIEAAQSQLNIDNKKIAAKKFNKIAGSLADARDAAEQELVDNLDGVSADLNSHGTGDETDSAGERERRTHEDQYVDTE